MNQEIRESVKQEKYDAAHRVAQVGTFFDFLLTVGKIGVGILAGSAALIAEGIHSAADLLFDFVVLVGMKFARKEPDDTHPYGHGKFESLATLILAVLLLFVAFGLLLDGVGRLQSTGLKAPGQLALWVALASILIKEALYHYTVTVGRRIHSKITIANAWHHRADAISSFAALVGIGGALLGWPIMDPLAAMGVAFFVGKVGFEILNSALHELTDAASSVDHEVRERIARLVHEQSEVRSAHLLKARRLGHDILVDVHVVVNPFLTVSEGHQIADRIQLDLFNEVEAISDVLVHVDTEDDQNQVVVPIHPGRQELRGRVEEMATPMGQTVQCIAPHYLPVGIVLEVFLAADPKGLVAEAARQARRLGEALLARYPDFAGIRLHLTLEELKRS